MALAGEGKGREEGAELPSSLSSAVLSATLCVKTAPNDYVNNGVVFSVNRKCPEVPLPLKPAPRSKSRVQAYYNTAVATLSRSSSMLSSASSPFYSSSAPSSASSSTSAKLSWFRRTKTWSFRRNKGSLSSSSMSSSSSSASAVSPSPDLTIIYGEDASEWDEYLSECFRNAITRDLKSNCPGFSMGAALKIVHQRVEDIHFPISLSKTHNYSQSKGILLIISPDFLDYIDSHPEVFELGRLLDPKRTVSMLCGVQANELTSFHKAALVSYDQWPCLVAKDQDKEFVIRVIQTITDILYQPKARVSFTHGLRTITGCVSPLFKLTPRKVREGNGKVFLVLNKPVKDRNQSLKVLLDISNKGDRSKLREVVVRVRNPYTLQFVIPDDLLHVSRVVNVMLFMDPDDDYLGSRPLKVESKMSELFSLLSTINSPYEFLSQTLGVTTLSEVDAELTKRFVQNSPGSGFNLLDVVNHGKGSLERRKSDLELPTLLHFSCRYGLKGLTEQLLRTPGAATVCRLRNVRGLTPAQLSNQSNYREIGVLVEDFAEGWSQNGTQVNVLYDQMDHLKDSLISRDSPKPPKIVCSSVTEREVFDDSVCGSDHKVLGERLRKESNDFLYTEISRPEPSAERSPPLVSVVPGVATRPDIAEVAPKKQSKESLERRMTLTESQMDLIKIMEAFKSGNSSIEEAEVLFREWQVKSGPEMAPNDNSPADLRLRHQYHNNVAKAGGLQKQAFSFSDWRHYLVSKLKSEKEKERGRDGGRDGDRDRDGKEKEGQLLNKVKPRLSFTLSPTPSKGSSSSSWRRSASASSVSSTAIAASKSSRDEPEIKRKSVSTITASLSSSAMPSSLILSPSDNGNKTPPSSSSALRITLPMDRYGSGGSSLSCDSGNHSAPESTDESNRSPTLRESEALHGNNNQNTNNANNSCHYYKVPVTTRRPLAITCSPPAPPPPPRPTTLLKFHQLSDKSNGYYNMTTQTSTDYEAEDDDDKTYMMASEVRRALGRSPSTGQLAPQADKEQAIHHLQSLSSDSGAPLKRDPLTDYDRVPSGPPVPVVPSRALRADLDYDVPRIFGGKGTASRKAKEVRTEVRPSTGIGQGTSTGTGDVERQIFV